MHIAGLFNNKNDRDHLVGQLTTADLVSELEIENYFHRAIWSMRGNLFKMNGDLVKICKIGTPIIFLFIIMLILQSSLASER